MLQGSCSGIISRGSCLSDSLPIDALAVPLWCSVPCCRWDSFHPFLTVMAACCCLRYWLGFYRTLQQQLCVSHLLSSLASISFDAISLVPSQWPNFHQDFLSGWVGYHVASCKNKFQSIKYGRPIPCPFPQAEPTPLENQHACSRLSPTSLWLIDRGIGHLPTFPRCTLWESASCLGFSLFRCCFLLVSISNYNEATSNTILQLTEGRPPGQWRHWAMQQPAKKKSIFQLLLAVDQRFQNSITINPCS